MKTRIISSKKLSQTIRENSDEFFSLDTFKGLENKSDKVYYCNKFLTFIGLGSTRITYKLGEDKVLKIATTPKGLTGNSSENIVFTKMPDAVTQIYEIDENFNYVISEYAENATIEDFQSLIGNSFEDITLYIEYSGDTSQLATNFPDKENIWESTEEKQFFQNLKQLMQLKVKELNNISSWGKVYRNGVETIVMREYSFNKSRN